MDEDNAPAAAPQPRRPPPEVLGFAVISAQCFLLARVTSGACSNARYISCTLPTSVIGEMMSAEGRQSMCRMHRAECDMVCAGRWMRTASKVCSDGRGGDEMAVAPSIAQRQQHE